MTDTLVDIITPVYQCGNYLDEFFSSLLNQTFVKFHVFAVYDESNDNSLDILNKYSNKLNLTIIHNDTKQGVGYARNLPFENDLIHSKYYIFLDSDDFIEPEFFEKMINKIEEDNSDICICGFKRFDSESKKIISVEMCNNPSLISIGDSNTDLLGYINDAPWNKLFRTNKFISLRFGKERHAEDVFYYLKTLRFCEKISFINEPLYNYRTRVDGLMGSLNMERFISLEPSLAEISELSKCIDGRLEDEIINVINLVVFIRFAIGTPLRVSWSDRKSKPFKFSLYILNKYFKNWKKNKFLCYKFYKKRGFKGFALKICLFFYRIHCFPFLAKLYTFYVRIFKKEVHW